MTSSGQQFNLRWNNHTNNILQVFMDNLNNESMVDTSLSCEGKFIKAHKMVLSACSPYFQELFALHNQLLHPIIILNGICFNELKLLVEFMYKGEIQVKENDLQGVLQTAEVLQIKGLSTVRNKYDKAAAKAATSGFSDKEHSTGGSAKSSGTFSAAAANGVPVKTASHNNDGCSKDFKILLKPSLQHQSKLNVTDQVPSVSDLSKKLNDGEAAYCTTESSHGDNSKTSGADGSAENKSSQSGGNNIEGNHGTDDDLPTLIKVEPLDIKDIDGEGGGESSSFNNDCSDTYSPKLVIDMPSVKVKDETEPKLPHGSAAYVKTSDEYLSKKDSVPNDKCQLTFKRKQNWSSISEKIPRPPNAFMIFANEWRRKLANQHPLEDNKAISKRLGLIWKTLSVDAKEKYYKASRKANDDHKKKYPNYFYSPKEARLRKRMRLKGKLGYFGQTRNTGPSSLLSLSFVESSVNTKTGVNVEEELTDNLMEVLNEKGAGDSDCEDMNLEEVIEYGSESEQDDKNDIQLLVESVKRKK